MRWQCGRHGFEWSQGRPTSPDAPVLMGVLNVTPDSFSDGGAFIRPDAAVEHALAMVSAGARIIDIGGESSRPGAEPVSIGIEIERVVPVIEALRARSSVCISVDTTKAPVAARALAAGADIINDITAMRADRAMVALAAESGAGVVLMHMRGTPSTMQMGDLSSDDIVAHVVDDLGERAEALVSAGVARDAICVDPGIGFGKTVEQNLDLIVGLDRLAALDLPILLGVSRKSFLGAVTGRPTDSRLAATGAACAIGIWRGAHLIRVHDVAEMRDVARVSAALAARLQPGVGR